MATLEERKQTLRESRMCRFCLYNGESLTSIYEKQPLTQNQIPLPLQIMACVSIEVFPTDGMPKTICSICRYFMDQSYRFKQICKQADEALRHYISSGDMYEPIKWPQVLIKHVPSSVIRTEGTTSNLDVKPLSQKESNNQKALSTKLFLPKKRPNIHVKTEEPPTKIKVVQDGDTLLFSTGDDNEDDDDEESTTIELQTVDSKTTAISQKNNYPCEYCDRTFPLQQLLDIHLQHHLKERLHKCEICERSYFTKYDLQKHLLVHSGEKPFMCVVCKKAFSKSTLLRRHEKTHVNVPRMNCDECDQSFLSEEELVAHRDKKHSLNRPFICSECPKRFAFKQGLERHSIVHSIVKPFKCNYCPESFTANIKLMRHIQTHAGDRPYPCKFCPKSFLLSHHYTRHLRSKHMQPSENTSKTKTQTHKCLQCNSVFDKQEQLIFHSAVHATEDLTCPLCKEKFEDIDSVTIHVKAHIDVKEEYVCEWCELIFMCEEKLNNHIDSEHGDNLIGDPHEEITYLENKLVVDDNLVYKEEEQEAEDDDDEEDEYYDASHQDDSLLDVKPTMGSIVVDNKTYNFNIAEMEIDFVDTNQGEGAANKNNGEAAGPRVAYSPKSTPIILQQKIIPPIKPKTSILQKAAMVKKITQQSQPQQPPQVAKENSKINNIPQEALPPKPAPKTPTKPVNISNISSNQESPTIVSPVSRTNEKSLILLEQDIAELKKGADANQQRFPTFRESFPKKSTLNLYKKQLQEERNKPIIIRRPSPEKKSLDKSSSDEKNSPEKSPEVKKKLLVNKTSSAYEKNLPEKSPEVKKIVDSSQEKKAADLLPIMKEYSKKKQDSDSDYSELEIDEDDDDQKYDPSSPPRRSGRPSKVKDYAAMIRDNSRMEDSDEDKLSDLSSESDSEEEEYKVNSIPSFDKKKPGKRGRGRPKKNPLPEDTPSSIPGKRGRGRPPKPKFDADGSLIEREAKPQSTTENTPIKDDSLSIPKKKRGRPRKNPQSDIKYESTPLRYESIPRYSSTPKTPYTGAKIDNLIQSEVLKTPTGQTLKKVSAEMMKSLTKDIKVLPLPPKVVEMKMGPKTVKVQRVLMTKAEVEEMTKKGLVEFKDGAMVLKPGVKLPVVAQENKGPSVSAPQEEEPSEVVAVKSEISQVSSEDNVENNINEK